MSLDVTWARSSTSSLSPSSSDVMLAFSSVPSSPTPFVFHCQCSSRFRCFSSFLCVMYEVSIISYNSACFKSALYHLRRYSGPSLFNPRNDEVVWRGSQVSSSRTLVIVIRHPSIIQLVVSMRLRLIP
jgi:hypothetical protein